MSGHFTKVYGFFAGGRFSVLFCLIVLLATGCAKAVQPTSETDTPEQHYATGMRKLAEDDLAEAEKEFMRAVALAPGNPRGYTGMAFLELKRDNYGEALDYAGDAIDRDDSFADAFTARGAVYCTRKRGSDWFDDAREPLERALELDPGNQRALYYLAGAHMKARQFEKAREFYARAKDLDGTFKKEAEKRQDIMTRLLAVMPIPESTGYIYLEDTVDRGEISMLLIEVFELPEKLREHRPVMFEAVFTDDFELKNDMEVPPDVNRHPLKQWIMTILPLNIDELRTYPNGYFYPDRVLTRAMFAAIVQDILVRLTGEEQLATRYVGAASRFNDVRPDFYAFNAITLVCELGFMKGDPKTGGFKPRKTVRGIEALEVLRAVEAYLTADGTEE